MPIARKILLDRSDRLQRMPVPPDDLVRLAARLRKRGVEVIDLSRLSHAASDHSDSIDNALAADGWQSASFDERAHLRELIAAWYRKRFEVILDPELEITLVPNTILALHFLTLSFVNPGEMVLLPDPGLPYQRGAVALCNAGVMPYNLLERNDYLPSFAMLDTGLVGRIPMMVLGYPHNPTGASADLATLTESVAFARRHNILIAYDAAFTFATSGAYRPRTFLEARGAQSVGVEMASIGANFGVPGLALTAVCGNREAISAAAFLAEAAQALPTRQSVAIAEVLFERAEQHLAHRTDALAHARTVLTETAVALRWKPRSSPTSPFLWVAVDAAVGSRAFCRRLLRRAGILCAPGTDFGERGEGFVRMVLPETRRTVDEVAQRLASHARLYQKRLSRRRMGQRARRSEGKDAV
ncbi:MAG TPA: aminotransferase class I/II-fold pyridoxal phosphate-dependent enzyme [candidate division Zixibacteria bacterium]|jgi:aspartate/methionine/tyrosine aminotransferase